MGVDQAVIELDQIRAGYGDTEILHGIDLKIESGAWEVLLGPNGSGKTTMLKVLTGQLQVASGSATIDGRDCFADQQELKRIVGYLPEDTFLYNDLSGFDHLQFAGDMHGIPPNILSDRIGELLDFFNLTDSATEPVKKYSLGMKRKLELCIALIHQPRVLFLDEPMNGLDLQSAESVRELLLQLCQSRKLTLLMSTHNLGMLHRYCTTVVIYNAGRVLLKKTPAELAEQYPGLSLEEVFLQTIREVSNPPPLLFEDADNSGSNGSEA